MASEPNIHFIKNTDLIDVAKQIKKDEASEKELNKNEKEYLRLKYVQDAIKEQIEQARQDERKKYIEEFDNINKTDLPPMKKWFMFREYINDLKINQIPKNGK